MRSCCTFDAATVPRTADGWDRIGCVAAADGNSLCVPDAGAGGDAAAVAVVVTSVVGSWWADRAGICLRVVGTHRRRVTMCSRWCHSSRAIANAAVAIVAAAVGFDCSPIAAGWTDWMLMDRWTLMTSMFASIVRCWTLQPLTLSLAHWRSFRCKRQAVVEPSWWRCCHCQQYDRRWWTRRSLTWRYGCCCCRRYRRCRVIASVSWWPIDDAGRLSRQCWMTCVWRTAAWSCDSLWAPVVDGRVCLWPGSIPLRRRCARNGWPDSRNGRGMLWRWVVPGTRC